ncbi:aminotransferase [Cyathus striatus]|nr:aminotransferase [Cyathus striatus]
MSSCLQYCPNVFEGMKAYLNPEGKPLLFRPQLNMARLARSAERVALPPFNTNALLTLIQKLVLLEKRWIPTQPGYSLYIRPTVIGTRATLGVAASDSACLYIIVSPTGPYFRGGTKPVNLLAVGESVRSWPGGTGGHKLGLNYAPGFLPQRIAAKQGYDQVLWLLGEDSKITEVGAMNFFVVVKREDEDLDVITPPLDGTILPGLTRLSSLTLCNAHTEGKLTLPTVPATTKLYTHERTLTISDVASYAAEDKLVEAFGVGTAAIVAPVGKIGFEGKDILLPKYEAGLGPVGKGLWEMITEIQTGRREFEGWSVPCRE